MLMLPPLPKYCARIWLGLPGQVQKSRAFDLPLDQLASTPPAMLHGVVA
jgi:hypothetical protein